VSSDRRRLHGDYADRARRLALDAVPAGDPYGPVIEELQRPGLGLPPALCLATCAVHGGSIDDAMPVAAALVLLERALEVRDDVRHGRTTLGGQESISKRHGVAAALDAADAMAAIATALLHSGLGPLDCRRSIAVAAEFDRIVRHTLEGRAMELGWRGHRKADAELAHYVRMAVGRTAWHKTTGPMRVGAIVATGRVDDTFAVPFGTNLGVVYDMACDIAGDCVTGIREGRPTVMMIHLMGQGSDGDRDHDRLIRYLQRPAERTEGNSRWVCEQMSTAPVRDRAMEHLAGVARAGIDTAWESFGRRTDSTDRQLLLSAVPDTLAALTVP
jgi:geranylgeranyl diphosphate synthase, type II